MAKTDWLQKIADGDDYDCCEDFINSECATYADLGELFAALAEYHGGKWDDECVRLIAGIMGDYIDNTI